ncbi:MAG: DUF6588 family protein [bacterium]
MYRALKIIMLLIGTFVCTNFGYTQINNVEDLLRGGLDDANLLLKEYLTPFGKGFGADLNNGWFNTAKTHKFLGFDITVTANAAIAPTSDETFDISKLGLQNLRLTDPNADPKTPTIVGEDESGPELSLFLNNPITGEPDSLTAFEMPQGIGFRYVPSPMIQASLGLFANTEVMLRFFPEIEVSKDVGSLKMFGLGVKHDLKQWLPGGGLLPFDLSVMAGYTIFQAHADLSLEPDPDLTPTGASYEDQKVELEATSFTLNFLISKQFAILTLFGGLGIETSSVDLKLKGNYPVTVFEDDPNSSNFGEEVIEDLVNPVNISIDGANTMRANVGFRLKLVFLTIHGSYTFSNYPVATAGVGINVR